MKKERYTCDDVEALLHEMAEHDRQCCRMSDALTERLLREIDGVANRVARERFYRISAQMVAACLVLSGFVVYEYLMHKEPVANELHADSAAIDSGCQPSMNKGNRAVLSQLDSSMEAGFSPLPRETYASKSNRRYGVSVCEQFEYTACTDSL